MMKDLKSMHEQNLVAHEKDKYIDITRAGVSRDILLSLDGEVWMALLEACESACMENSMVPTKTAHIIRHDIFLENVKFEADFTRDKQNMSIIFSAQ